MIKVKVTHPYGNWPLARQTPNNSGVWGDCQFFINDNTEECDYWFVFDDLLNEEFVSCDRKNTIIITLEFPEIRPNINSIFLKQFGAVFTYSREIKHPKVINILAPFPWHIGVDSTNSQTIAGDYKVYNDFQLDFTTTKTKLISVISSNKTYIEGHRKRLEFVEALKQHFGNKIDIFGRGINDFADKWDVITPYKYHISLENSSCHNGISEKLYDAFLGESFPFYYGSPNASDYFPQQSFIPINVNCIEDSLRLIESTILNDSFEKNIQYIKQSKFLILNEYNIFNLITNYCNNDLKFKIQNKNKKLNHFKPESHFTSNIIQSLKKTIKNFI